MYVAAISQLGATDETIAGSDVIEFYNTFISEEEVDEKKLDKVLVIFFDAHCLAKKNETYCMNDMYLECGCSMKERLLIAFLQT